MKKYFTQFASLLILSLVFFLFVNGFGFAKAKVNTRTNNASENSEKSKPQVGINIRNLTHHILDFNK